MDGVPDGMRIVAELPEPPRFTLRVRTGDTVPPEVSDAAMSAISDIAAQRVAVHV